MEDAQVIGPLEAGGVGGMAQVHRAAKLLDRLVFVGGQPFGELFEDQPDVLGAEPQQARDQLHDGGAGHDGADHIRGRMHAAGGGE